MFLMKNFSRAVNPLKSDLKRPRTSMSTKKKVSKIENYQNYRLHVMVGHVNVSTIRGYLLYAVRYPAVGVDLTMFNRSERISN